jgi:DNA invertase Pin-like site-specific DNA recombinase
MFAVAGAMAQLERDLARERVQAGMDAARARGVMPGRPKAKLDVAALRHTIDELGGLRPACRALGLSTTTAQRHLRAARTR